MNRLLFILILLISQIFPLYSAESKDQTEISIDGFKIVATNVDGKLVGERWIQDSPGSITRVQVTFEPLALPSKTNSSEIESPSVFHLLLHTLDKAGTDNSTAILFHGSLYLAPFGKTPALAQTNRVQILSSPDSTRIIMIVLDNGPVYTTTNSGLTWRTSNKPGSYKFPLVIGTNGAELSASAEIHPPDSSVPAIDLATQSWYVKSQESGGNQLILTGNSSQSSPALTISQTANGIIISWPGDFPNYFLQANPDLATTNWAEVTNVPIKVQDEYQVPLPSSAQRSFFRLRSKQSN